MFQDKDKNQNPWVNTSFLSQFIIPESYTGNKTDLEFPHPNEIINPQRYQDRLNGILGSIRSYDGIVIVSDDKDDNVHSTAVFEINQNRVDAVSRGKLEVKDFFR